jgi:predicted SAM-dependent methyltransferase
MLFRPRTWLEPHLIEVLDLVRSEWAAIKGRMFLPKHIPNRGKEYLQIGSGDSHFDGFLNSGFFCDKMVEALVDVRFPLRFPDNNWRGIYAHHVVEHISYPDAFQLFRECRRTLKIGGVFRMVVPNLEAFIDSTRPTDRLSGQRSSDSIQATS